MNGDRSWTSQNVGLEKVVSVLAQRNGRRRQGGGQSTLMLAHSPAAPAVLYAGSQLGIFRSDDQGQTWVKMTRPNSEWVTMKDYDGRDTNYCLTRHGGNFANLFSRYSSIDAFHILASAPSDPNYVALTDNDTIRLSRDGGKTWEDVLFEYGEPFDEGRSPATGPQRRTRTERAGEGRRSSWRGTRPLTRSTPTRSLSHTTTSGCGSPVTPATGGSMPRAGSSEPDRGETRRIQLVATPGSRQAAWFRKLARWSR